MVGLFEVFVVGLVEHILTTDFPSSPRHTRSDAHTHTHMHTYIAQDAVSFFLFSRCYHQCSSSHGSRVLHQRSAVVNRRCECGELLIGDA